MVRRLLATTAAASLLAGVAIAQTTPPTTPPATTPPAAKQMPPAADAAGARQFITQQTNDQWLATRFKGTDVIGTNNERIGDVTDILFDRNGRIVAYVIGVGGFLGLGTKDVALAPAAFQVQMDRDEVKLRLAMTRDELKNAPEFKMLSSRTAPTTGQSPNTDRTTPKAPPR